MAEQLPFRDPNTDDAYIQAIEAIVPDYRARCELVSRREADNELIVHGLLSEADLLAVYTKISNLSEFEEDEHAQLPELFEKVQPDFLLNWSLLPWRWDEQTLTLIAADPYAAAHGIYLFQKLYKRKVTVYLGRKSTIDRLIRKIYLNEGEDQHVVNSEENLINMASDARIIRLVNEMLARSTELNASDIHVEPDETYVQIRFRIDGLLRQFMTLPISEYPAIASRIKLVGGLNIAESRLPQDGRANLHIGRVEMDVRISTIPIVHGESIVMRILRKDRIEFDLRKLGMSDALLTRFNKLTAIPHGMILVAGPTGSGKTTTLYSVISNLNRPDKKIITVEDPVEYRFSGLAQMQVNPKVGLTFANGLRNIVRQDPDIILVGEIRDRETAEIAVNAALTGHLVLSTIHTNDAPGAISRLLDMGVESFLLSSALYGVLSQRLVRKICPECKGKKQTQKPDDKNEGCKLCRNSGYKGRMGIYELMIVNDALREAITRREDNHTLFRLARESGMIPLIEDGLSKVAAHLTTREEVLRAAMAFDTENPVETPPAPDAPSAETPPGA